MEATELQWARQDKRDTLKTFMRLFHRKLWFDHCGFETQKAFTPKLLTSIGLIVSYAIEISMIASEFFNREGKSLVYAHTL